MTNEELIEHIKYSLKIGADITLTEEDTKQIIKALEQIPDLKEAYNKGYRDGQEAFAVHYELCKEEGSVIAIPEGATNGDMIKDMFPNAKKHESIEYHNILFAPSCHLECCNEDWWNSPYRKEQE